MRQKPACLLLLLALPALANPDGSNPVCANADPTSFDQVYACMTWANDNSRNRFGGNSGTADCRAISSTYIALLQEGGAMTRETALSRAPGSRTPVTSRIPDCAQALSNYEFALTRADSAGKMPAGYTKPGCDVAERLIAEWSQTTATAQTAPETSRRRGSQSIPAPRPAPQEPDRVCDYWDKVDLTAWDAEMDRMFRTFKGIEVTKDEVEAAWQMDYERSKARWPGNDPQARRMTRPRRTLRIFLRKEKYKARHSRELSDEEVRVYMRLSPDATEEQIRKMSDLGLKVNMAQYSACNCGCSKPKLKEICTSGVYYGYDMAKIYVPKRWRQNACFDEGVLPDGAMEP